MSAFRSTKHTRGRHDRGASLVELALVLPLLALLAFGTAEMGLAWVASNRVESSTSTAARIAASSGSQTEADRNVLISLRSSLPEAALENLDRVVIFKPADADGTVPATCIKAVGLTTQLGVNGQCNTYSGATVRAVGTTTNLGAADDYWKPVDRLDSLADPPDYIGVWVRTFHEDVTGTFWDDFTVTKTSVYRIQPDIDG